MPDHATLQVLYIIKVYLIYDLYQTKLVAEQPMLNFKCPRCGKKFSTNPEAAGRRTKCPKCSNPFRIPLPLDVPDSDIAIPLTEESEQQVSQENESPTADAPNSSASKPTLSLIKIGWGPAIVIFLGVTTTLGGIFGTEIEDRIDTLVVTRGWLRAAVEKKPEIEFIPVFGKRKMTGKDRAGFIIMGLLSFVGGVIWAVKRRPGVLKRLESQFLFDSAGWMPALNLHQAFLANKITAKEKYNNYRLRLHGTITKIDVKAIELDNVLHCQGSILDFPESRLVSFQKIPMSIREAPLISRILPSSILGFSKDLLLSLNIGEIVYVSGTCKVLTDRITIKGCIVEKE